jgi:hypothetical protein
LDDVVTRVRRERWTFDRSGDFAGKQGDFAGKEIVKFIMTFLDGEDLIVRMSEQSDAKVSDSPAIM